MSHATRAATQEFAQRHPGLRFRPFGRTGLTTSALGFGGYRIDDETTEHRAALERALSLGCNLIDTSTNYTDGGSERLIGQVLRTAFQAGSLRREQVIVVSKVGYVQGQNLALAHSREAEKRPFPEMVRYAEGCWHCLHPEFIADQLERSLGRLGLSKLDVLLLHNPEYFLSDARKRRDPRKLEELRSAFYGRIEAAFRHLESEVKQGRIAYYGVSSNTFGSAENDAEATSLSRMWEIATKIGGESHHFAVAQLPLNLFESGPVLENNNQGQSALEFARAHEIAVLVNRPLNAIVQGQIVRLADFARKETPGTLAEFLRGVGKLEEEFARVFVPRIQIEQGAVAATEFFRWSRELATLERQPIGLEQWGQLEQQILAQTEYLATQLDVYFAEQPAWKEWRLRYRPQLRFLLDAFYNECAERSQKVSSSLSRALDSFLPPKLRTETLSRKALATVIQTPGTTCTLNGMRTPAYVDDSMGAMGLEGFDVSPALYRAFCKS